ncbi:hypothetical protein MANAM107_08140 [Actinomyces capricornis]|uniref:Uncharacterized protein n=1 Tax=Actinomyces capricornis TaxID=2755559 RepID=A0ABM7U968_9ACTO|nr:hypothetical protein MANAM107_08140 [Actinomyces capricornis]
MPLSWSVRQFPTSPEFAEAVRAAREQSLSWRGVGEAIGTSCETGRTLVIKHAQ